MVGVALGQCTETRYALGMGYLHPQSEEETKVDSTSRSVTSCLLDISCYVCPGFGFTADL